MNYNQDENNFNINMNLNLQMHLGNNNQIIQSVIKTFIIVY